MGYVFLPFLFAAALLGYFGAHTAAIVVMVAGLVISAWVGWVLARDD